MWIWGQQESKHMIIIGLHTFISVSDRVQICNIAAYLGITLEVAVSIVTVHGDRTAFNTTIIGVWYDSLLIRATVQVSCYTKVVLQCTRDRVSEYRACLYPSGLCPRRVSNPVLQANLLYLYFSIPLSPLSPFVCLLESLYLARLLNAERSASTKRVLQSSLAVL